MVVRRTKKIRKRRGSRTCGYGMSKKHRGGGSRGGRGNAGMLKHKKTWMVKYDPDHFGRKGFKVPVKAKNVIKAITLRDLDILARKLGKSEIDVSELGYDKILSKGTLTQPLTIKAKKVVERARKKIEESGGKVVDNA
jgi:large subunit ribosomal protein L15